MYCSSNVHSINPNAYKWRPLNENISLNYNFAQMYRMPALMLSLYLNSKQEISFDTVNRTVNTGLVLFTSKVVYLYLR